MNFQHYFMLIGVKEMKIKIIRFIENEKIKRKEILAVINLVAVVLQNGMGILGVSLPKKM